MGGMHYQFQRCPVLPGGSSNVIFGSWKRQNLDRDIRVSCFFFFVFLRKKIILSMFFLKDICNGIIAILVKRLTIKQTFHFH